MDPIKRKKLEESLSNNNVKWLLYNLYRYESGKINGKVNLGGHNESSGDSTAFGAMQFIGSTRNSIKNSYGIDAWKGDLNEQQLAVVALLDSNNDLDSILSGDFTKLKNSKYWEAFSKDKNFSRLTNDKPNNWESSLDSYQKDAIYEPEKSWNSLSPKIRKDKKFWYDKKYKGQHPHDLGDADGNIIKKEIKPLDDKEASEVFNKYEIEKAEARKNFSGKDQKKQLNDELHSIQKFYQKEYGIENLVKGKGLYNAKTRKDFLDNVEIGGDGKGTKGVSKKFDRIKKEQDALTRERDLLDPNTKEGAKRLGQIESEIKSLGQERLGAFANIRLYANKKNIANLKKSLPNLEVGSDEYKQTVKSIKSAEDHNIKIRNDFGNKAKEEWRSGIRVPGAQAVDPINHGYLSEYTGDGSSIENVDDLMSLSKMDEEAIQIDSNNPDYIISGGNDSNNKARSQKELEDASKGKKDQFTFDTNFEGLESDAPTSFLDDEEAKQGFGGYLKDNPMAVVSAALGVKGLIDSQSDVPIPEVTDNSNLSESFYEHLRNLEKISKKGFTPEEEAAFLKRVNDGYVASIDNAVRASGGNKAQVLNQAGQINANKNSALLDFSAQDAELHRKNLHNYGKALEYSEAFAERKDIRRQTNDYATKNAEYKEAIDKRTGGAMLAAGSLKSLIDSVKNYRETGTGSVLDNYRKDIAKNLKLDGMQIDPRTGKYFANEEDYASYRKDKTATADGLRNGASNLQYSLDNLKATSPQKEALVSRYNTSDNDIKSLIQRQMATPGNDIDSIMKRITPQQGIAPIETAGVQSFDSLKDLGAKELEIPNLSGSYFTGEDTKVAGEVDEIDYNIK